jgi:hypothetical protein
MKRPAWMLALLLLGFMGGLTVARRGRHEPPRILSADSSAVLDEAAASEGLERMRRSSLPAPPPPNFPALARFIAEESEGTYIDELIRARNGHVARWNVRADDPVQVWIQPASSVNDWMPQYPRQIRDAFRAWDAAGLPVRFAFTDDSVGAEVKLRWVDHFKDAAAGRTYWSRDQHWWIFGADIDVALHATSGARYDALAVRTIALHEVGHLLGLDHTTDETSVMFPRVRVTTLGPADLATAVLLYRLPPGAVTTDTLRKLSGPGR